MGKWKFFNWLLVGIILVFMYRYFAVRYGASLTVYVLSTIGWLMMAGLGYYIFVFKIYKKESRKVRREQSAKPQRSVVRERPKVILKKNGDNKL